MVGVVFLSFFSFFPCTLLFLAVLMSCLLMPCCLVVLSSCILMSCQVLFSCLRLSLVYVFVVFIFVVFVFPSVCFGSSPLLSCPALSCLYREGKNRPPYHRGTARKRGRVFGLVKCRLMLGLCVSFVSCVISRVIGEWGVGGCQGNIGMQQIQIQIQIRKEQEGRKEGSSEEMR